LQTAYDAIFKSKDVRYTEEANNYVTSRK